MVYANDTLISCLLLTWQNHSSQLPTPTGEGPSCSDTCSEFLLPPKHQAAQVPGFCLWGDCPHPKLHDLAMQFPKPSLAPVPLTTLGAGTHLAQPEPDPFWPQSPCWGPSILLESACQPRPHLPGQAWAGKVSCSPGPTLGFWTKRTGRTSASPETSLSPNCPSRGSLSLQPRSLLAGPQSQTFPPHGARAKTLGFLQMPSHLPSVRVVLNEPQTQSHRTGQCHSSMLYDRPG